MEATKSAGQAGAAGCVATTEAGKNAMTTRGSPTALTVPTIVVPLLRGNGVAQGNSSGAPKATTSDGGKEINVGIRAVNNAVVQTTTAVAVKIETVGEPQAKDLGAAAFTSADTPAS